MKEKEVEEERRKKEEKKTKKGEDNRGEESSRRIGNIRWGRKSSWVRKKAKRLVLERFYKWIYVFGKKVSERMLVKKVWYHVLKRERYICQNWR